MILITLCVVILPALGVRVCRDIAQVKQYWRQWKFYREKLIITWGIRRWWVNDWRLNVYALDFSFHMQEENGSVILLGKVMLLCIIWWGSGWRHPLEPSIFYQVSNFFTSLGAVFILFLTLSSQLSHLIKKEHSVGCANGISFHPHLQNTHMIIHAFCLIGCSIGSVWSDPWWPLGCNLLHLQLAHSTLLLHSRSLVPCIFQVHSSTLPFQGPAHSAFSSPRYSPCWSPV